MFAYKPEHHKVLLVDENTDSLIFIKNMLTPLKLDIYIAQNGSEAMQRIKQTDFDMIILDIVMPDIEGYEVCRQIKSMEGGNDISLIFMCGAQDHEAKSKALESGADDYIHKPFDEQEALLRIQIHLKKRSVIKSLKKLLKLSYHELYNPLSIIRTSAEMYGYHYPKNRYVDTMHAAAKSLHFIYEDLYYALGMKKTTPPKEIIHLASFLRKRVDYFALLAEVKNISIELNADESCSMDMVLSDLQRIVDNTISNAIKHSYENTVIRVSLNKTSKVIFRVTNHGSTIINPHYIFTDGYREGYNTIGMGIGLEIVASICHRLNIRTLVESSDGMTTFTYHFPEEIG